MPKWRVSRILNELIIPNSEKLHQMAARGEIPVIIFEPLRSHTNWGPHGTIVPMKKWQKRAIAKYSKEIGEEAFDKWLTRQLPRGMVKIFAIIHLGILIFNWASGY